MEELEIFCIVMIVTDQLVTDQLGIIVRWVRVTLMMIMMTIFVNVFVTGRTGPGVCYRLFSEDEYTKMDHYSTPEIQRVPLDSLLLQMIAMGLPDARKFPFIEPPPSESIENSILSLKEQVCLLSVLAFNV